MTAIRSLSLNPALAEFPAYQPGRPIEEVAREFGLPPESIIKLASNENPLGPSPKALAAMAEVLPQLHFYPDGTAFHLKRKMAEHLALPGEHLIFGNGSNEIIEFVGHALMAPGTEVIVSQYCFAVYPMMTHLFGAQLVKVPAVAYGHDPDAMLRAVTPRTRVLFVANPNNPTGTLLSRDAVMRLIHGVPAHVLLVMDEAYVEFLTDPVDLVSVVRSREKPNLLLMRTFSKILGLAGLRLGYGIGHPELISALEKVRQPFNTNALVQAGAMAALDDQEHMARTRANNASGLKLFEEEFARWGWEYIPSAANFILVRVGSGGAVTEALQRRGVIVRPMASYELPEWIRITIGTPEQNARCLAVLREVVKN
jgi:histidinol-phosphate aminotransferase